MVRRPARFRRSSSQKSGSARKRVLRSESLEPRELLSGNGLLPWMNGHGLLQLAGMVGAAANARPVVATPISVNGGSAIIGKTAFLSVLGCDDGGESKLVYRWTVTSSPAGGVATFSANGANAAKNTIATFNEAGSYAFTVTIVDAGGLSVSSTKAVVVVPVLSSVRVTPNSASVCEGAKQQFAACGLDQFQNAMTTQPAFAWSASGGTITAAGLFTAPSALGNCTITAKTGSLAGVAVVQVISPTPTVVQAISVNGGAAITGKTASLSVLGSGPGGASALDLQLDGYVRACRRHRDLQRQRNQCGQQHDGHIQRGRPVHVHRDDRGRRFLGEQLEDGRGDSDGKRHPPRHARRTSRELPNDVERGGHEPDDRRPRAGPVRRRHGRAARVLLVDDAAYRLDAHAGFHDQREHSDGRVHEGRLLCLDRQGRQQIQYFEYGRVDCDSDVDERVRDAEHGLSLPGRHAAVRRQRL